MTHIQGRRITEPTPPRGRPRIPFRRRQTVALRASGRTSEWTSHSEWKESNPNSSPLATLPAATDSHAIYPAFRLSETLVTWMKREPANGMTTSGRYRASRLRQHESSSTAEPSGARAVDGKCEWRLPMLPGQGQRARRQSKDGAHRLKECLPKRYANEPAPEPANSETREWPARVVPERESASG